MTYSGLRKSSRISLRDSAPLGWPLSMYIEPTNKCNFKCRFCPESLDDYEEISGGSYMLDEGGWNLISDQIVEITQGHGIKTLNFYMMGEPFLNPKLLGYIRDAKLRGLADRLIVTSNGSLIRSSLHADLVRSGLDYLRISIYGADETDQKANTQTRIPLERVQKNLRDLISARDKMGSSTPYVYVKMIDQLSDHKNQCFLSGFSGIADEVAIEPRMDWNSPENVNLAGVPRDELLSSSYHGNLKSCCPFPFYTLVIHADLQVSVCCVDWSKSLVIGSLSESRLTDIWNGRKLRNIQLAHLRGMRNSIEACRNCAYLHTSPDTLDGLTAEEFLSRSQRLSGIRGS